MSERYKLIYYAWVDGEKKTHIENVSYTMAMALKRLLVMQGADEDRLDVEEDSAALKGEKGNATGDP